MRKFDPFQVIIPRAVGLQGRHRGGKTAVICHQQRFSWSEFVERIYRVANGLIDRGFRKGDKVSLLSSNCIEIPEIIMGTVLAGGVIVPLSAMVPGEALARMVENSDSSFLFVNTKLAHVLEPFISSFDKVQKDHCFVIRGDSTDRQSYDAFLESSRPVDPNVKITYDDPFNIMYTSGTTGLPKGIVHHHGNRMYFASVIGQDLEINSGSITAVTTSLYANGTWLMLLPTLFAGGTLVIMETFDPDSFAALVHKEKCTHTFMAPVQFQVILENEHFEHYDFSSMKIWLSAGSTMRTEIKKQVLTKFPGEFMELWGLTEGVATTIRQREIQNGKLESVGLPLPGNDIRIIDDDGNELPREKMGEIVGYSPFLMPEYYKLPEKTAEEIWIDEDGQTHLRTGDMGKLDEDGYLYILDRKKDMIVSGGINIFASDIEEVLSKHPDVGDVAVISIPHDKWGETPLALVIKNPGSPVSEEEILEWANPKLAKYQRVHALEFANEFPRNALGKVLKRQLRETYGENKA